MAGPAPAVSPVRPRCTLSRAEGPVVSAKQKREPTGAAAARAPLRVAQSAARLLVAAASAPAYRCGCAALRCSFILFTDVDIDRKIEFKFRQVDTDNSGQSLQHAIAARGRNAVTASMSCGIPGRRGHHPYWEATVGDPQRRRIGGSWIGWDRPTASGRLHAVCRVCCRNGVCRVLVCAGVCAGV